ncbi:DUF2798 domain-containing protein [Streptococcus saliviloxodontae]|uniref:DUF2798 domain-containing protein n=1 Tax=Streptococcus saliviloxodontae TaxID=1349416 RepID=A0ABS2PL45_9STRE|nr:DUF2798 domain-containing protein [Streptococcus saliviloxodontae]MBM7636089.1 hypothetical protein [Streptococcus saliviloxodontae]
MPRNFKEAMIFTCLMCGMMVLGMSIWNLIVAGHFSWFHVALGYLPGFVVAFLLDVILVGPLAKKFALSIIMTTPHHDKRWVKIVGISGSMVLGMVTCMSFYGILMSGQDLSVQTYVRTWLTNFVAAIPLNFLIVGPISRAILGYFQKPLDGEDEVEDFNNDEEMPKII